MAGVVLIPLLILRSRRAVRPALDLSLFRIRNFQASNVATLVFSVAFFAVLLSSLLFLQNVWHYSVLKSALAVSPSALVTALVAPLAGRLAERFGYRPVFVTGALFYAAGAAALALRTGASPHWAAHWLPTSCSTASGSAWPSPPSTAPRRRRCHRSASVSAPRSTTASGSWAPCSASASSWPSWGRRPARRSWGTTTVSGGCWP
ncbi:MFS transporter [Streptomyces malaysiensis]|uniref:MFS transporter n=1 Tax=Streptomyces malaysiensis TaxID=92644 RepID=UPI0037206075